MREALETIVKLTLDETYSHKARMIEIRTTAEAALAELKKAPAVAPQTGNQVPAKSPAPAAAPAK
jgi:hypothetical protein